MRMRFGRSARSPRYRLCAVKLAVGLLAVVLAAALADTQSSPALEKLTVQSDGHPVVIWARRPAQPKGAVLFVHGRTWSGRPDFDLQVPGLRRSVLEAFAGRGYAAYAVDLRGYGSTPRDATKFLTPRRGAADISNVLQWMAKQHPSLPKPTLVGWSRGAAMAGMAALNTPGLLSNLVLYGFTFDPDLTFAELDESELKPNMDKNTREAAASDFISPKVTPRAVVDAFVTQAMQADPILADLKNDGEFNDFKPASLGTPTLVLFGSEDPGVTLVDAGKMLARMPVTDKQLVVLPGADHAAHLEDTHDAWVAAIVNFINRPSPKR